MFLFLIAQAVLANPDVSTSMHENFWTLRSTREAVISNDLDAVHKSADHLLTVKLPEGDGPMKTFRENLHANVRALSKASTKADAATLVSNVAVACGGCHQATGGGPKLFPEHTYEKDEAGEAGLELMWLSIISNNSMMWREGRHAMAVWGMPADQLALVSAADTPDKRAVVFATMMKGIEPPKPAKPDSVTD